MTDPEFGNTDANLDFVFRSLDTLIVVTNHQSGEEAVHFSHEGSGFTARVLFSPLDKSGMRYRARFNAYLEGRQIRLKETVALEPQDRLVYAWCTMQEGFRQLYVPDQND